MRTNFTESFYIIDFSSKQWTLAKAVWDETPSVSILRQIGADIGFQRQKDESVEVFFQPAIEELDWRLPDVIRLTDLTDEWYRITDEVVAHHLLEAVVQELSSELIEQPGELYVVIPYRWQAMNRRHLRQIFGANRKLRSEFRIPHSAFRIPEGIVPLQFRGFVNEGIAMLSYWQNELAITFPGNFDLLWLDGRLRDLKVWHYHWCETYIDIKSVSIFDEYVSQDSGALAREIETVIASNISNTSQKDFVILGTGDADALTTLAQTLTEKLSVTFSDIQNNQQSMETLLRGAVYWVRSLTGRGNFATGYQINYYWAFGVQLDSNRILEIIPKGTALPVRRQRALTVQGELSPFSLNLYCCFAPLVNSGLLLASLRIEPERKFIQRGRFEILLEVELFNGMRGKFSALVEAQEKWQMTSFRVPVLIE
ncbi:hypothetical protein H8E77_23105 [bacterium]|nr:hypothetical protein [bacterium]